MSDALYSGSRFRVLNIIDEGVREALDIVVDTSITAVRLVRVLELLKSQFGTPKAIRVDNGPEFTAQAFVDWCCENDVRIDYIQPGKPNQNAYIERFNRSYRDEVLDPHILSTLSQVSDLGMADELQRRATAQVAREHPAGRIQTADPGRNLYFRVVTLTVSLRSNLPGHEPLDRVVSRRSTYKFKRDV